MSSFLTISLSSQFAQSAHEKVKRADSTSILPRFAGSQSKHRSEKLKKKLLALNKEPLSPRGEQEDSWPLRHRAERLAGPFHPGQLL